MGTIGSQFLAQDFEECVASVQKAEEAGYSHAWFVDSQILWQDCYVYMTHALAATQRIVVGTAVTNPYTRHVTATASMFTTLAELHPGRLVLGIGRGDSAVRTMGLNPCQDVRAGGVGRAAARPDGRPARDDQRRRRAPPLARPRPGDPDHDARDRAEEPARWPARSPTASCSTSASTRPPCAGRSTTFGRAPRRPAATRTRSSCRSSPRCGSSDDQEEAWDRCRWAPAACANHIADTMKRNPAHGMPETMTRLAAEPRRLRLLRGPPRSSDADHTAFLTGELIDDFAIAGLRRQGACAKVQELVRASASTRSRARTRTEASTRWTRVGREIISAVATTTA